MTKEELTIYLHRLSEALVKQDVIGEIVLFGGAAMVLAFNARVSTKDVDAIFEPKDLVYKAAALVSQEFGAPDGWLNDAVKGFLSDKGVSTLFLDLPNLKVYMGTPEYLLAMKCMSMRIGKEETDIKDIIFLMRHLELRDAAAVLKIVEHFYPYNLIQPKTRFAIEELCQNIGAE